MNGVRIRRAEKTHYASRGVVELIYPANDRPDWRAVKNAWHAHRERNYQTVELGQCIACIELPRHVVYLFLATYGPVVGNSKADYNRKAVRVAELTRASSGRLISETFERWPERKQ